MIQSLFKLKRFGKALVAIGVLATVAGIASAQQDIREREPKSVDATMSAEAKRRGDNAEPITRAEEEMRAKRAIKETDREYQENLGRARDLSNLGTSIVLSFKVKNGLDQDALKKLEKLEKLAKSIRRAAGGSEDKVEMDEPPKDVASAMAMLSDLSQSIKVQVEKTPKHVVSATVIDEANVLLELIRIVRTLPAKV